MGRKGCAEILIMSGENSKEARFVIFVELEGDVSEKVPKSPLWLRCRSTISRVRKTRLSVPAQPSAAVWAQAVRQSGPAGCRFRAGIQCAGGCSSCRRRGLGHELVGGAFGWDGAWHLGKERGRKASVALRTSGFLLPPFLSVSLFWKKVVLRNDSGEQMSKLTAKPIHVKYFKAVASSNILLKLANPHFSNLCINTQIRQEKYWAAWPSAGFNLTNIEFFFTLKKVALNETC